MFEQFGEYDGNYALKISDEDTRLIVTPNTTTWENANTSDTPFFIQANTHDYSEDVFLVLTIEQAEELRDFLTKKIDYLKEKKSEGEK